MESKSTLANPFSFLLKIYSEIQNSLCIFLRAGIFITWKKTKGGKMSSREKSSEVDLTNQWPHVTRLWMTSFVVFVVCSVHSSTANCSGWTQNLIRKHQGYYFTQDRDSSLFTQEYAKELFEGQGNIIYKDISRKSKAPHEDLICTASVENKLMLFTRWKSCNGHLCYTVENSEVFTCKENFFGVAFNRCLEDTIFLCGFLFQKPTLHRTTRTSIYHRNAQELTKEQL